MIHFSYNIHLTGLITHLPTSHTVYTSLCESICKELSLSARYLAEVFIAELYLYNMPEWGGEGGEGARITCLFVDTEFTVLRELKRTQQ